MAAVKPALAKSFPTNKSFSTDKSSSTKKRA